MPLHGAEKPARAGSGAPLATVLVLKERPVRELVAQLVEQRPFKAWVLGSSPSELTKPFIINDL